MFGQDENPVGTTAACNHLPDAAAAPQQSLTDQVCFDPWPHHDPRRP
jgi:hypothetical protein